MEMAYGRGNSVGMSRLGGVDKAVSGLLGFHTGHGSHHRFPRGVRSIVFPRERLIRNVSGDPAEQYTEE